MASTLNASTSSGLISSGDTSGILQLQTANTAALTIDTSANVGIGTASPAAKLELGSGTLLLPNNVFIQQKDSSGNAKNVAGVNSSNQYNFGGLDGSSTVNTIRALVAGNEAMRIDSSGNLLVGTTSTFSPGGVPTTNSVSNGTSGNWAQGIRNTASSIPYGLAITYTNAAPNSTGSQFIYCPDTTGTKFEARSNGGIANFSANNVNLSDQREKKNIEFAGNYLNKICQIPVKTFLFNDQTDDELNLGAIAQEVQAVAPELVHESNWGTDENPRMRLSIYQTDLQYALMKSIQELKAINDTQAETINALTARIVALEGV